MKKVMQIPAVISLLALTLVGCASKEEKANKIKPNELPKIQATQSIAQVFNLTGASSKKYDPLRLQLEHIGGVYYSADAEGHVRATKDNKVIWEKRPSKNLTAGVSLGQGALLIGTEKGKLIALDATNGETLWQQQLSGSILSPSLISNNRVITVANDGTLYANDIQTGQQLWTYSLPENQFSVRGHAVPVMVDERMLAVATSDANIVIIDSITGVPVWQNRVAVSDGRSEIQRLIDIDGQPQIFGTLLVTVSFQGQVTLTDLKTQQILWSEPASSLNSPAVDAQAVYVSTSDGKLVAYQLQTGQKLWENDTLLHRTLSNPVILDGVLVVGDYEGVLHLVNPATGELTGRAQTKGAVRTLRVEDHMLYVSTTKGNFSIWQKR